MVVLMMPRHDRLGFEPLGKFGERRVAAAASRRLLVRFRLLSHDNRHDGAGNVERSTPGVDGAGVAETRLAAQAVLHVADVQFIVVLAAFGEGAKRQEQRCRVRPSTDRQQQRVAGLDAAPLAQGLADGGDAGFPMVRRLDGGVICHEHPNMIPIGLIIAGTDPGTG